MKGGSSRGGWSQGRKTSHAHALAHTGTCVHACTHVHTGKKRPATAAVPLSPDPELGQNTGESNKQMPRSTSNFAQHTQILQQLAHIHRSTNGSAQQTDPPAARPHTQIHQRLAYMHKSTSVPRCLPRVALLFLHRVPSPISLSTASTCTHTHTAAAAAVAACRQRQKTACARGHLSLSNYAIRHTSMQANTCTPTQAHMRLHARVHMRTYMHMSSSSSSSSSSSKISRQVGSGRTSTGP